MKHPYFSTKGTAQSISLANAGVSCHTLPANDESKYRKYRTNLLLYVIVGTGKGIDATSHQGASATAPANDIPAEEDREDTLRWPWTRSYFEEHW